MSKGLSIATPKDFKGLDDDQIDRIPHALIGILVEGYAYGLASVDVRRKWLVPNNGNRRKRLQARFREVGIGLTIEEATEENDQADWWWAGFLVEAAHDEDVTEDPLPPIRNSMQSMLGELICPSKRHGQL